MGTRRLKAIAYPVGVAIVLALAIEASFVWGYPSIAVASAPLLALAVFVIVMIATTRASPSREGETAMPDRSQTLKPNMPAPAFVVLALVYLVITVFVIGVLYANSVLDLRLGIFGVTLPAFLYLALVAYVAYKVQDKLSRAYGHGRTADFIVSLPMLIVVGSALLIWAGLPYVESIVRKILGVFFDPVDATPNEYKLVAVVLFGLVALWDVFFRDLFGVGRRSSYSGKYPAYRDVRREDLVSGTHGDLPDATEVIESRSGEPEWRMRGKGILEVDWVVQDPFTGEYLPVKKLPPRMAARMTDRLVDHEPTGPRPSDEGGRNA